MSKRLKAKLTAKLKKNKNISKQLSGDAGLLTERIKIEFEKVRKEKESKKK